MKTEDAILRAALACARKHGFATMTRDQIAEHAGVAVGSLNYHFETMENLRNAVVKHIIESHKFMDVLAAAISARNYHALRAPAELKQLASETLAA